MIAGIASAAFSESLLGASTSLPSNFLKPFICGDDPEAAEVSLSRKTQLQLWRWSYKKQ